MLTTSSSALSDLANSSPLQSHTSVELLRFKQLASGALVKDGCENMGDEIVNYIAGEDFPARVDCQTPNQSQVEVPRDAAYLQFVFLGSIRNEQGCTTNRVEITKSTLLALCIQLRVSLNFLDGVLKPSIWSKQSGGCFHVYDDQDQVEAINGFYHYFNEWHLGPLHTWFTYNIKTKCTTYLLFDCPQSVKAKLLAGDFLSHPLIVDVLLAEECALWREALIDKRYKEIFNWVRLFLAAWCNSTNKS